MRGKRKRKKCYEGFLLFVCVCVCLLMHACSIGSHEVAAQVMGAYVSSYPPFLLVAVEILGNLLPRLDALPGEIDVCDHDHTR